MKNRIDRRFYDHSLRLNIVKYFCKKTKYNGFLQILHKNYEN